MRQRTTGCITGRVIGVTAPSIYSSPLVGGFVAPLVVDSNPFGGNSPEIESR
jgi:hypothetical protein